MISWLRGYFVGPKFFLVGISRIEKFFSRVFRGFKIFSRRFFVGSKIFRVGITLVHISFLVASFMISYFQLLDALINT